VIRNMRPVRAALLVALSITLLVAGAGAAFAAGSSATKAKTTTVTVVVGDTAGLNGPMTMTVTPESAPAGKVKFKVQNQGTIIHEMVVLKATAPFDQLPVTNDKVSEAKKVGEVSSIGKGKTKSKTLKLKAGSYALVCNVAKHYGLGMRAGFTVT
jgi:uncharacterized cupredoxin-like copper-binding protein